ncbi:protein FAM151B isoform X3 [Motacilla alba alba]|uniref:protein FAM151B isoform X3 n=1 Tax=Motacilla alba alba TaxID=1094192 RepID=UPI0018D4DB2A|nr:protein FAM151B isoform X3 [Motacilla alba alba]
MASAARGAWSEWPVDHFLRCGRIAARDGAAVRWFHAANSSARAAEAARSDVHMVEEWLAQMGSTNKGIKLDFKSLAAVGPSLELLGQAGQALDRPVWLNGDILPGPGGSCAPLDARAFLRAVTSSCPDATLSLGWTTGCHRGQGYEWPAVQEMWQLCLPLSQPVSFAVRAALVPGSIPQLQWLLQQCPRFSLTVWTGKEDVYSVEDLLLIRENFDKSRVYYDIFEPQNSEFRKAIGIEQ